MGLQDALKRCSPLNRLIFPAPPPSYARRRTADGAWWPGLGETGVVQWVAADDRARARAARAARVKRLVELPGRGHDLAKPRGAAIEHCVPSCATPTTGRAGRCARRSLLPLLILRAW